MEEDKVIGVQIIDDGKSNPVVSVPPEVVTEWLRAIADAAGYADRASCMVQIVVDRPFADRGTLHNEPPRLNFMVSNIKGSRSQRDET